MAYLRSTLTSGSTLRRQALNLKNTFITQGLIGVSHTERRGPCSSHLR